ncbi:MAG: hypothetical protein ACTSV7_03625, partial [Candidatus Baldrarchaeia archaeon]
MPEKPLPIICLEDLIEEWGYSEGAIIIKPKPPVNFDNFFIRVKIAGFEKKYEFTGLVNIVPEESMNDETADLYRKLKNMEVQLEWKGFFKKKPIFVTSSNIFLLRKHLPKIRPDNMLAEAFNRNKNLMRVIMYVKPMMIDIHLKSLPKDIWKEITVPEGDMGKMLMKSIRSYYENPQ